MALGKIRRWNARKSGDGSLCGIRRWILIFCNFNKAVSGFRRRLLRKSGFESEDVPRRLAAVGVRILSADAVDQAQVVARRSR